MASPELPHDTYRLTDIPSHFRREDVRDLLSVEDQDAVFRISLAPALLPHYKTTKVATITLCRKSPSLRAATRTGEIKANENKSRLGIDNDFYGFTPLNDATENSSTVDVIAMTGLAGRAFASWQSPEGHMWLRDFLPDDVPSCRVMTFGYPSQLSGSLSEAGLLDYSDYFIKQLLNIRKPNSNRPMVLIGHSLGCLIIKYAFVILSGEPDSGLFKSIYSIVFFGAPHRGLDTKPLELLLADRPKENLIREMREDSSILQFLNRKFPEVAKYIQILTVCERQQTPTTISLPDGSWARQGQPAMAVKQTSACLSMPNEEVISVDQNHSTIAKLSKNPGSAYHTILRYISEYVKAAPAPSEDSKELDISGSSDSNTIIFNYLPEPHRNFLGRDNLLKNLREQLSQTSVNPALVVLHGIGGGGKSQIARKYVRLHEKDYGAIFWVNFSSQLRMEEGFLEAAERIKEISGREINNEGVNYVKSWLEKCHSRWLLILDNVDDHTFVSSLVSKYLPSRGNGEIIITTRNRELCGIGFDIDVPSLDDDDAAELLLLITKQGETRVLPKAIEIAKLLGGHPLAVAQAGAYIATMRIPMDRYIQLYSKKKRQFLDYKNPLSPEEQTAATTFEISFERLKDKEPNAAFLLLLFSFLDRSISFEILQCAFESRSDASDEEQKLPQWLLFTATTDGDWDEDKLHRNTAALYNFSLIDKSVDFEFPTTCSIHPIVQEWSQSRLSPDQQQDFTRIAIRLVHRCSLKLQEDLTTDRSTAFVKQKILLLHIESCIENSKRYLTEPLFIGGPTTKRAALRFSHLLWYNGKFEEARVLQQRILDKLPTDNPLFMETTLAFATSLRKQGNFVKAAQTLKKAESFVKTEKEKLGLLAEIADIYRDQNSLIDACQIREAILDRLKVVENQDSTSTINAKGALAVVYSKINRGDEALRLELEVLEQRKRICGMSHPDTFTAMANLASTFYERCDYERAEKLEKEVLELRRQILGEDHWETIRAEGSLGATFRKQGRLSEAASLLGETLRKKMARVGPDNPSSRRTYRLLHATLLEMKNMEAVHELEASFELAKLSF